MVKKYNEDNLPEMKSYSKRHTKGFQLYVKALKIDENFFIETEKGLINGKAGDYLMQNIFGEVYICNRDNFESSYKLVDKS
jgi:uncharacterized protein YciU (UPF0263 family)